jgi:hypothetical protein
MAPPVQTATRPQAARMPNRPQPALPRIMPAIPLSFNKASISNRPNASSRNDSASVASSDVVAHKDTTAKDGYNLVEKEPGAGVTPAISAKSEGMTEGAIEKNAGDEVASRDVNGTPMLEDKMLKSMFHFYMIFPNF